MKTNMYAFLFAINIKQGGGFGRPLFFLTQGNKGENLAKIVLGNK